MESKPVFLLATAHTCGHCATFRSEWPRIRDELERMDQVRIIDCEVPTFADLPDPDIYPADLSLRWVRWFPTIMLFNGASWDNAVPNSGRDVANAKLQGVIFNGYMDDNTDEAMPVRGAPAPTLDRVMSWVNKELPKLKSKPSLDGNSILSLLAARSNQGSGSKPVSNQGSNQGPGNLRNPVPSRRDVVLTQGRSTIASVPVSAQMSALDVPLTPSTPPLEPLVLNYPPETQYIPTTGSVCRMRIRPKN